jgi:DNA mismatch endonuclease (patch repair protein)
MASVRQRGTKPEMAVRSMLHRMGFRFRLYRNDLPGTPDIVLPMHKLAIFVHGCFWHQHAGCRLSKRPSSNRVYWEGKLDENVLRDRKKEDELSRQGWRVAVVWGCETKNADALKERLASIMAERSQFPS